jgi:lysozyme
MLIGQSQNPTTPAPLPRQDPPVAAAALPEGDFVDVSHHQGDVDWDKYAAAGKKMAMLKVTEGGDWSDPKAADNRAELGKLGLQTGLYHFEGAGGGDATAEANFYLKTVGTMGPKEFPILDFEQPGSLTPAQQTTWISNWCNTVETATGKTPWLYTGEKILHGLDPTNLTKYPLWLADYNSHDRGTPPEAAPWPNLTAWQFTDKASTPGVTGQTDSSFLYINPAPL